MLANVQNFSVKFNNKIRLLRDLPKAQRLLPNDKIKPFLEYNRKTLNLVSNWIDDDVYKNSIFQYGLPENVKHLINNDVGEEMTYSDVLLYLSSFLQKKVEYLEIGVSVGKNIFQVMNYLEQSCITGFDIEEINPVLENFLTLKSKVEWTTLNDSIKKDKSSLTEYDYSNKNNLVRYISGDVFDENSWKYLADRKYNIIFSDAFHSGEALLYEWEMIVKNNLLDPDEFIIIWDDLGGKMESSFMNIWSELRQKYNLKADNKLRIKLNGWLGLKVHQIGIIMKLPSKNIV